jgi:hypothetical protein
MINIFKKKEAALLEGGEVVYVEKPPYSDDWEGLVANIAVGTNLKLAGVCLIVSECSPGEPCRVFKDSDLSWRPGSVSCIYSDTRGRLCSHDFYSDSRLLLKRLVGHY